MQNLSLVSDLVNVCCEQRSDFIPRVLDGPVLNENYIGSKQGFPVKISFKTPVFIETVVLTFYHKDDRQYTYDIYLDTEKEKKVYLYKRRISKKEDLVKIGRTGVTALYFDGRNDKNPNIHFINIKIMGCLSQTKSELQNLARSSIMKVICNANEKNIPKILDGPIKNENWIGAKFGSAIKIEFSIPVFIEKIEITFYYQDGRTYTYNMEYIQESKRISHFAKRKAKKFDTVVLEQENVTCLFFEGINTKNRGFHFINLKIWGKLYVNNLETGIFEAKILANKLMSKLDGLRVLIESNRKEDVLQEKKENKEPDYTTFSLQNLFDEKLRMMKYIEKIDNEIKERNEDNANCSICFDNPKDHILIPCGHVFCGICIKNLTQCPQCRQIISKMQKIFL